MIEKGRDMKKILAFALTALFISGCVYYPYRAMPQPRAKSDTKAAKPSPADVRQTADKGAPAADANAAPPFIIEEKPAPAPMKKNLQPSPDDLFFSFDLAPAGAKGIFTAAFGWQPKGGPLDFTFGMGAGILGWGWSDLDCEDISTDNLKTFNTFYARTRLLLRNAKSTPFLYLIYSYNMAVPQETYTLDLDTATYTVGPSTFLGAGFGFLWRIDPRINFTFSLGYDKCLRNPRITYESGDTPAMAPELYKKLQDHVPDDTPAASLGIEFRF